MWDEPDLLQNVKCVNPWLVELVSNMPAFNLSPFSPPRKKQRFIQEDPYFHLINQLPMPPSLSTNILSYTNSLCNIQDNNNHNSINSSTCIQGARHAQFGPAPSDFPFNKLQQNMFLSRLQQPIRPNTKTKTNVDISCLLSVGNSGQSYKESSNEVKAPHILLFGKLIQTEQKSSNSASNSTTGNSVSDGNSLKTSNSSSDNDIGLGFALNQSSPVENSSDDGGSTWYKDQLGTENVSSLCMAL